MFLKIYINIISTITYISLISVNITYAIYFSLFELIENSSKCIIVSWFIYFNLYFIIISFPIEGVKSNGMTTLLLPNILGGLERFSIICSS